MNRTVVGVIAIIMLATSIYGIASGKIFLFKERSESSLYGYVDGLGNEYKGESQQAAYSRCVYNGEGGCTQIGCGIEASH